MENINIDAKEVIEWVTQRRKLKLDWNQKLKALENKTQSVIENIKRKSIPELDEVFKTNENEKATYIHLKEILEGLIKSPEGEDKNFFGQYKSQNIKDVQALIKLYEKEFLSFANLAQNLIQLVTYDIPFCRKVTKSNQNTIKDLDFKISAYESSIGNASKEILKLVSKYDPNSEMCEDDIDKFNVNEFIEGFVKSLGSRIAAIETKLDKIDIEKMTDYYFRFAAYNNGSEVDQSTFTLIKILKQYGDVPLNDYRNVRVSVLNQDAKSEMYSKLLSAKGFGPIDLVLDDQQWEIEDVDNPNKDDISAYDNPTIDNQTNIETIITDRESRESVLESLYEVR